MTRVLLAGVLLAAGCASGHPTALPFPAPGIGYGSPDPIRPVPSRASRDRVSPSPRATHVPPMRHVTIIRPPAVRRPRPVRLVRSLGLPEVLLRIRSCESGGQGYATGGHAHDYDYRLTNPTSTASGAWQGLDSTWNGWRGYARARDAPRAVQDAWALRLYAADGTRPWDASRPCWGSS